MGAGVTPTAPTPPAPSLPSIPMTGLQAWYLADFDTYTDVGMTVAAGVGDPVRGWKDQSGNLNHVTLTAGTPGTLAADGSAKKITTAASQTMTMTTELVLATFSVYAVLKDDFNGSAAYIFRDVPGNAIGLLVNSLLVYHSPGGADHTAAATQNAKQLLKVSNTSGSQVVQVNANAATLSSQLGGAGTFTIAGSDVIGHYSEFLLYNTILSGADDTTVKDYLNAKYTIY